jgi:pimeloyl-ACP methyl ester carboxylesterase
VVLLHANTGSSRNWDYQIPAFTAAGYRVIAYDRRDGDDRQQHRTRSREPRQTTSML